MADENSTVSLRTEAITTLIRQGPAWVILAGFLYVLLQAGNYCVNTVIPKHLEQIQAGYMSLRDRQDHAINKIVEMQGKDREVMVQQHAIMSASLAEIRETNDNIRKLVDEVRVRRTVGDKP